MAEALEFQQTPRNVDLKEGTPVLYFEPRSYPVAIEEINVDFSRISHDLVNMLGSGEPGLFTPLPIKDQLIVPELGVSRKIACTHPAYPEHVFWITGIGLTQEGARNSLKIGKPDTAKTVFDVAVAMPENAMQTWGVGPHGENMSMTSRSPAGAYWKQDAQTKFGLTLLMQQIADNKYGTAIPVAEGSYDPTKRKNELGFFVYAVPKTAKPYFTIYDDDRPFAENVVNQGYSTKEFCIALKDSKPVQSVWRFMAALQDVNSHDLMHRQYHPGNLLYEDNEDGSITPWITDFDTLLNVHSYETGYRWHLGMSPKDKARWTEIQHAVLNVTSHTRLGVVYQIPMTAGAIMGYEGVALVDDNTWDQYITKILISFRALHNQTLDEAIKENPDTVRGKVFLACNDFLEMWLLGSNILPSLKEERESIRIAAS